MMQLATIASFLVLLYGLFGTIAAANNGLKAITSYDMETAMNDDNPTTDFENSCAFGVQTVSIVLFTNNIPQGQVVEINESCKLFNSSNRVVFLIHRFLSNPYRYNFSELALQLVKKNYTVFSLDWSNAACYNAPFPLNRIGYAFAARNTRNVSDYLTRFIISVINVCRVPIKNISLIGHCMGAHISGFAGKKLQDSHYGKLPLIIGIDPTAPLFINCPDRLCKTDAERVVTLHASSIGIQHSKTAHFNLWFNGGFCQPEFSGLCGFGFNYSHNKVINYVIVLLENYAFVGVPIPYKPIPIPNFVSGCFSDKTNSIVVDNRIFDNKYTITGDYCVDVSMEYPYGTKNNISCQK